MNHSHRFVLHVALWLVTLAVFPVPVTLWGRSFAVEVFGRTIPQVSLSAVESALPPETQDDAISFHDRVVARILQAEMSEPDAWFRDDYRVARVTLGYARTGSAIPHIEASYRVLGCHPEQVWPRIVARREVLLAREYEKVFGGSLSPRKPCASAALAEGECSGNTNGLRATNSQAA